MAVAAEDHAESEFAILLKHLRVESGLSQQTLADRALVSVQAISALERGYRKAPYRHTIDRLVAALELGDDERVRFVEAAARARERGPLPAHRLALRTNNLPRQLTAFFGGDAVTDKVTELVTEGPLVTIVGTGGAGKTRAAVEAGMKSVPDFSQGVWFVDLAPLKSEGLVATAIGSAVGFQEPTRQPLVEALLAYLEHRQLLLILDNCEHLIAAVRQIVGLVLRRCPEITVLVTSREPLAMSGEQVYRIPPLTFPRERPAGASDALSYGAVALFEDRARKADGRFSLTDGNAADVALICRRLDGLPLAIELAAARVTVLSPRQLAGRLDRIFSVLTRGDQAILPRHQTMRTAIDWSYDLLSAQARMLFERLAIFSGGFTLDSVAAICSGDSIDEGDVLELLASLVDKSLVIADCAGDDARYRLLDSTRQYALERLEGNDVAPLAGRHATAFLALAERLDGDWYSAVERDWFAEARAELDNCRAALEWSLEAGGDLLSGQRLAAALARVWYSLSVVEGRRWIRRALDVVDSRTPPMVLARLFLAESKLHGAVGEFGAALASGEAALNALQALHDPLQLAQARHATGSALTGLGRVAEGEALLRDALNAARSLGNDRLRAMVLGDFGTARSRRGDVDGARAFYAEALGIYTSRGFDRPAASIAGHLAEVEFAAGDPVVALQRAQDALAGHVAANNRRSAANDLSNMAAYFVSLDRLDEARTHATEALALAIDTHATALTIFALQHVAAVATLRSRAEPGRARRDKGWAAELLGFVDERLKSLSARREYTEEQEFKRIQAILVHTLGPEFDEHFARGREWTERRAIAEALEI